jgi:hypothetical protein
MVLRRAKGPIEGAAVVHRALNHIVTSAPDQPPRAGASPTRQTTQPLAIYRLDLDQIKKHDFLRAASQTGWRYLVVEEVPVAVADVREMPQGGAEFSQVSRGAVPQGLLRAAQMASERYGSHIAQEYDVRVLEIPSLYITALWLHGPGDVFFPIMKGQLGEVREDPGFLSDIMNQAQRAGSTGG